MIRTAFTFVYFRHEANKKTHTAACRFVIGNNCLFLFDHVDDEWNVTQICNAACSEVLFYQCFQCISSARTARQHSNSEIQFLSIHHLEKIEFASRQSLICSCAVIRVISEFQTICECRIISTHFTKCEKVKMMNTFIVLVFMAFCVAYSSAGKLFDSMGVCIKQNIFDKQRWLTIRRVVLMLC